MIEVRDLSVIKNGKAICSVNQLAVSKGTKLAVVGENGSGKTTLLRVLAGLENQFSGQINVAERPCVYVHQAPFTFRGSVLSNVRFGVEGKLFHTKKVRSAAVEWLERFDLRHVINQNATTLSGGEKRRVALARAFAVQPSVLLLDEPFAELDTTNARLVEQLIEEADCTVILSSPTIDEHWPAWDTFHLP
ncbi:MAG: ABC transporter ATP-binding protein [Planctomycetales bacterium]|nr:ABC transporter ATP-binding protein [Planctomycetales bacterium]